MLFGWIVINLIKKYIDRITHTHTHTHTSAISASVHRYVNYFDIQVLMMVTETETLTSTLHHNIFTYLDYGFFYYLHTVGFYPFLLSYIYIYIYIYICR